MWELLERVKELTEDVAEIVTAPVVVALDLLDAAAKPLAEAAAEVKDSIHSALKESP